MKKRPDTMDHLNFLAEHIAGLVRGLKSGLTPEVPPTIEARLKTIEALLRLKKAMIETRLLEEELHERLRPQSRKEARRGLSPDALAEIEQLLGLARAPAPLLPKSSEPRNEEA